MARTQFGGLWRRGPLTVVLSALTLALAAASAQAASLTLTPSFGTAAPGQAVAVTAQGTTERDATMSTYYELGGTVCAATSGNEGARLNSRMLDLRFPNTGTFSYVGEFSPDAYGSYLICGYVEYLGDRDQSSPRAAASTKVDVPLPSPPTNQLYVKSSGIEGEAVQFMSSVSASVPATFSLYLEPGSIGCAPSADAELARPESIQVGNRVAVRAPRELTVLYRPTIGDWTACSYMQEDDAPGRTANAMGRFSVRQRPSPRPIPPLSVDCPSVRTHYISASGISVIGGYSCTSVKRLLIAYFRKVVNSAQTTPGCAQRRGSAGCVVGVFRCTTTYDRATGRLVGRCKSKAQRVAFTEFDRGPD